MSNLLQLKIVIVSIFIRKLSNLFPLDMFFPDVPPSLYCYMRIDRALDSGIIFSVSIVKECSKHQILLCYH